MRNLLLRFHAWLRGGEIVWLEDNCGKEYVSIAVRNKFGKLTCPVYPLANVGNCVLLENGRVDPNSESAYIKRWTK